MEDKKSITAKSYGAALEAKEREIGLVREENGILHKALGSIEVEVEKLRKSLEEKNNTHQDALKRLETAEDEIRRLAGVEAQLAGREAMIVKANEQNRALLIVLQEADNKCKSLARENSEIRCALQRESSLSMKRLSRTNAQNERLRIAARACESELIQTRLAGLEHKKRVTAIESKREEELESFQLQLGEAKAESIHLTQAQFKLTEKLLETEAKQDHYESQCERQLNLLTAQTEHLDVLRHRLSALLDELRATEAILNSKNAFLLTETALAASESAKRIADSKHTKALEAALSQCLSSRNEQLHARQALKNRITLLESAHSAATLESSNLKKRIDRLTRSEDEYRTDFNRLQSKLKHTKKIVASQRSKLQSQRASSPFAS